jgi:hypothetical protein
MRVSRAAGLPSTIRETQVVSSARISKVKVLGGFAAAMRVTRGLKSGSGASGDESGDTDAGFVCDTVAAGMGADDIVPPDMVPAVDGVSTLGELADPESWVADDAGVDTGAGDGLEDTAGCETAGWA